MICTQTCATWQQCQSLIVFRKFCRIAQKNQNFAARANSAAQPKIPLLCHLMPSISRFLQRYLLHIWYEKTTVCWWCNRHI